MPAVKGRASGAAAHREAAEARAKDWRSKPILRGEEQAKPAGKIGAGQRLRSRPARPRQRRERRERTCLFARGCKDHLQDWIRRPVRSISSVRAVQIVSVTHRPYVDLGDGGGDFAARCCRFQRERKCSFAGFQADDL